MSEQFESMTVIELRSYAREHHIPLPAGVNKQGIIDILKKAAEQTGSGQNGQPPAEQAAPQETPPARKRTASIIADDGDYDDEELTYRQPPRPQQQTLFTQRQPSAPSPARTPEGARPAAGGKPDVLSTISSKAPVFNIEGVRAWHNPKSFQQGGTYNGGGYQQQPARQGWSKPGTGQGGASHTDQRPSSGGRTPLQPNGGAADVAPRAAEESRAPYGGDSRYLRDYHAVQKITLPELLAEGEFEDQQGVLSLEPDGSGLLYDERHPSRSRPVYIAHTQVRRFALREGDLISGKTKAIRETDGSRLMVYIEKVNGTQTDDLKDRPEFLNLEVGVPKEPIRLNTAEQTPLCFGQRILIRVSDGAAEPELIARLAETVCAAHQDADCILLGLTCTPEEGQAFMDRACCPALSVDIAQTAARKADAVRSALERAKRLAESGRKAVLLTDSLAMLDELESGTVSSGVFFGTGRALKNGGSVTVIGLMRDDEAELPGMKKLLRLASADIPADQLLND